MVQMRTAWRAASVFLTAALAFSIALSAAAEQPKLALVFSGAIENENTVKDLQLVRKLATPQSLKAPTSGSYSLLLRRPDGSVISKTRFESWFASNTSKDERSFITVIPFSPHYSQVEIQHKGKKIFSQKLRSGQQPQIRLLSPQGGEVWEKGVKRISWRLRNTTDDATVYIQYSPNNGTSWLPMALVGHRQTHVDVNVDDLTASSQALIYASVSDHLKTAEDKTERTFTIGPKKDGKPEKIDFHEDCLSHNPSAIRVKQINKRWKIVQGRRWMFDFDNKPKEARAAFAVIKRFRFDETCYIGRPNPSMTYMKAKGVVPSGPSKGLDCISFDRRTVRLKQEGNGWLLYSNKSRMAMFPNETEAGKALNVIKAYRLNRHCFIGRPQPSFEYWLSER